MKNEKYQDMYRLYSTGKSLSEVGKAFGMTRQSVYIGFKRRNFQLRAKNELDFIEYDGKKFTMRSKGYYSGTSGKRELLHRYKYQKEIGVIPSDWDVHHLDHNKENNDIDNLVAMPKSVHSSLFSTGGNQYGKGNRQNQGVGERKRAIDFYLARKQELASRNETERHLGGASR